MAIPEGADRASSQPREGLRQRKKRATQDAIERGAIELALEHGYENVTVEMICESATISQRTFFNYVGTKERAILGIDPPIPDAEGRKKYVEGEGGSPLQGLVATIAAAMSNMHGVDKTFLSRRREVIQANPALAMREFARMEEARALIVELVRERLRADAPDRDVAEIDDEARMVVSMTFGIMHYVVRDWIRGDVPADPTGVLQAATELARRVANA